MTDFRKPTAKVLIRGRSFSASEISVSSMVNNLPTLTVKGHFPEDAKKTLADSSLPLSAVVASAAELQNYILSQERLTPDVIITMDDGVGGVLNFEGFLSSPNYGISNGSTSLTYTAIHRAVVLSMFDGSIYAPIIAERDQALFAFKLKKTGFTGMLLEAMERAIKRYTENGTISTGSDSADALAPSIHARNQKLFPYIKQILESSNARTTYDGAAELLLRADQEALKTVLYQCFTAQNNLWDGLIGTFNSSFPCMFLAAFSTGVDAGFSLIDAVNEKGTDLTLPVEALSFSSGGAYSLPLRGVLLTTTQPYKAATTTETTPLEKVAAYWPDASASLGGRFLKLGVPFWIPDTMPAGLKTTQLPGVATRPTVAKVAAQQKKFSDIFEKNTEDAAKILKRYAQSQFVYNAIANSQAPLSVPLTLGLQVGLVYRIIAKSDSGSIPIFSGFLQSVSHTLNTDKSSATATTSIMFSHIRTAGVGLPGGQASSSGLGFNAGAGQIGGTSL